MTNAMELIVARPQYYTIHIKKTNIKKTLKNFLLVFKIEA